MDLSMITLLVLGVATVLNAASIATLARVIHRVAGRIQHLEQQWDRATGGQES